MRNVRRVRVLMQDRNDSGRLIARLTAHPLAIYDEPAGGSGGGEGSGGASAKGPSDEGRGVARNLLKRFRGRAEDAIAHMADENKDLRVERRELRDKLPKAGEVVLSADDAKAFNDYKALGPVADVAKKVTEHGTLSANVAENARLTAAEAAAKLDGGFNAAALKELAKAGHEVTVQTETRDGKAVEVPYIRNTNDKDAKPVALREFAKSSALYGPALTAKGDNGSSGSATGGQTGQRGTPYVEQGGASGATGSGASSQPNARRSVTSKYDDNAPWNRGKAPADAATK